jgi:hypothetical protein
MRIVWATSIRPRDKGWEREMKIEFVIIIRDISIMISENSL